MDLDLDPALLHCACQTVPYGTQHHNPQLNGRLVVTASLDCPIHRPGQAEDPVDDAWCWCSYGGAHDTANTACPKAVLGT